jgi:hypothetical protein
MYRLSGKSVEELFSSYLYRLYRPCTGCRKVSGPTFFISYIGLPMTSVSHITHKIFLLEISKASHLEVAMNTSTIALRVIGHYER